VYVSGKQVNSGTTNTPGGQMFFTTSAAVTDIVAISSTPDSSGRVGFVGLFGGVPTSASGGWHCEIGSTSALTSPKGWSWNYAPFPYDSSWPAATSTGTIAAPPSWASAASNYPNFPSSAQYISAGGGTASSGQALYCRLKISQFSAAPTFSPTPAPILRPPTLTPYPTSPPSTAPLPPSKGYDLIIAGINLQIYEGGTQVNSGTTNTPLAQQFFTTSTSVGDIIGILSTPDSSGNVGFVGIFGNIPTTAAINWHCEIGSTSTLTSPKGWSWNTPPYPYDSTWPNAISIGTISEPPSWASTSSSNYPNIPASAQFISAGSGTASSGNALYCRWKIPAILTASPSAVPTPFPSSRPTFLPTLGPTRPSPRPTPQPTFVPTTSAPTPTALYASPEPTPTAPNGETPTIPIVVIKTPVVYAISNNLFNVSTDVLTNSVIFGAAFANAIQFILNDSYIFGSVLTVTDISPITPPPSPPLFSAFMSSLFKSRRSLAAPPVITTGSNVSYEAEIVLEQTIFATTDQLTAGLNAAIKQACATPSNLANSTSKLAKYLKSKDPADLKFLSSITVSRNVSFHGNSCHSLKIDSHKNIAFTYFQSGNCLVHRRCSCHKINSRI